MFSRFRAVLKHFALGGALVMFSTLSIDSHASNLGVDLGHTYNPKREITSVKQRYDKLNPNQPMPAQIFPTMDVESDPIPGYPIKRASERVAVKPSSRKYPKASLTPASQRVDPVAYPDLIGDSGAVR